MALEGLKLSGITRNPFKKEIARSPVLLHHSSSQVRAPQKIDLAAKKDSNESWGLQTVNGKKMTVLKKFKTAKFEVSFLRSLRNFKSQKITVLFNSTTNR